MVIVEKLGERMKTVGELSQELLLKATPSSHSVSEQASEQLGEFEKNVYICLEEHKKIFDGDFFIVVLTKKEKLLENVIRNYFYGRISCPTPNYDQIVYKYSREEDSLEPLWVIPDQKTCLYFKWYTAEVNPTQFELLSNVLKFEDGTLFKLAKELNGEKEKTPDLKDD